MSSAEVGDITSDDGARALDNDPDVVGYAAELGGIFVPIDGRSTPVTMLDVIGLGRQTLDARHKHVGDLVTVASPEGRLLQLRSVGAIVPMSAVDSLESFGDGAEGSELSPDARHGGGARASHGQ